jgi:hypothetical protein
VKLPQVDRVPPELKGVASLGESSIVENRDSAHRPGSRAIWVQGADERYGGSEVADGRFDRLMHVQTISESCGLGYPHLVVKTKIAPPQTPVESHLGSGC